MNKTIKAFQTKNEFSFVRASRVNPMARAITQRQLCGASRFSQNSQRQSSAQKVKKPSTSACCDMWSCVGATLISAASPKAHAAPFKRHAKIVESNRVR